MNDLSPEEIEEFHQRLLNAKAMAEAVMHHSAEGVQGVEVSGSSIGRLTRMDAIQVQAMSQMNRAQLSIRMRQIDAALRAYRSGHYGRCNRCKSTIELARLEALPEAPLCMDCQEVVERS